MCWDQRLCTGVNVTQESRVTNSVAEELTIYSKLLEDNREMSRVRDTVNHLGKWVTSIATYAQHYRDKVRDLRKQLQDLEGQSPISEDGTSKVSALITLYSVMLFKV